MIRNASHFTINLGEKYHATSPPELLILLLEVSCIMSHSFVTYSLLQFRHSLLTLVLTE